MVKKSKKVNKKVVKKVNKKTTKKTIKKTLKITKPINIPPVNEPYIMSDIEREISRPSSWFKAVQRHENVAPSYIWSVNKEKIYENYGKKYIRTHDNNGTEVLTKISDLKSDQTAVDGHPNRDIMRIFSEQILVLPNGKTITPIRQYCETKILPTGTNECFFYDFGKVNLTSIAEGYDMVDSSPIIRSKSATTVPRGTRITVGYQQTEESPIDIIASANRAFALESINDEAKQVMNAFNQMKLYSDTDDKTLESRLFRIRKKIVSKFKKQKKHVPEMIDRWLDNNGNLIKDDGHITPKDNLTIKAVLDAKRLIEEQGLDSSNLVMYTSGKAIRDLTMDITLDKYVGHSRPAIITEDTLERILGVNLVRSSAIPDTVKRTIKKPENILQKIVRVFWGRERELIEVNGLGKRSVMFIPNVAFGLVSGRDLTMEAQRRNELQAIHITGTQKIAGLVKMVEATVRISHG